jgi:hypothetical protein
MLCDATNETSVIDKLGDDNKARVCKHCKQTCKYFEDTWRSQKDAEPGESPYGCQEKAEPGVSPYSCQSFA